MQTSRIGYAFAADFGVATAGSKLKTSRSVSSDGSFRSVAETQASSQESSRESLHGGHDLPCSSRQPLPSSPPGSERDSSQQPAQRPVDDDALQSAPSVVSLPAPSQPDEHLVEQPSLKISPVEALSSAEESRESPVEADVATTSFGKVVDASATGRSTAAAEAPLPVLSVRTSVTGSSDVGTAEVTFLQTPDAHLRPSSASHLKACSCLAPSQPLH